MPAGQALQAAPCVLCRPCRAPGRIPFQASGLRDARRRLRTRARPQRREVPAWHDRGEQAPARAPSHFATASRPAWLRLRRGSTPWAAPSTALASRCSASDPCRSFRLATSAGRVGGSRKASVQPSARRVNSKIIPGCRRARLRGGLRLSSVSAFPETPQIEPGRWCKRQSSASRTRAPLADSQGRSEAFERWPPRPLNYYGVRSRVRKVPRRVRKLFPSLLHYSFLLSSFFFRRIRFGF